MRYAIGVPGGPVRQYVTAPFYMVGDQVDDGEVAVATDIEGAATISADGTEVAPAG